MDNLQNESSGSDVTNLQLRLQELGFELSSIDGIFNSETEAAVKAFQDREGLAVDGIVGCSTQEALGLSS
jgi:peptidoglycan hydrolase-like protein with peptidoglycan-binding domain